MVVGWNFVSFPSGTEVSVSDALSTFTGSYDMVQIYNATSGNIETMASSDTMVPGYGYWIHVTQAGTWSVDW